ncbi:MAG: hypothetical protein HYT72_04750 [Candidatus Aenigmarchaeota archaeon]|nr:hypothetical protein [Candidatus Aenigmarchaeota archaeon]
MTFSFYRITDAGVAEHLKQGPESGLFAIQSGNKEAYFVPAWKYPSGVGNSVGHPVTGRRLPDRRILASIGIF